MRSASPTAALHPVRTCVGCRRTFAKPRLVRLGTVHRHVTVDAKAELPGRGCYVCHNPDCLERALQRDARRIRQALRVRNEDASVDGEAIRDRWRRAIGGPAG